MSTGIAPAAEPGETVVLASCDHGYAEWIAPLALSILESSPGTLFHVHVVNPTAADCQELALLRSLSRRVLDNRPLVSWTLDQLAPHPEWAALMACVRFPVAEQMLRAGVPRILIVDIDSIFRRPLDDWLSDEDLGLFRRDGQAPEVAWAAGAVMAGGAIGADFLAAIVRAINKRPLGWYIDQLAIGDAVKQAGGPPAGLMFFDLPRQAFERPGFMSWEWDPGALIWTGKGPRKSEDNAFTAEVARYRAMLEPEAVAARIWGPRPGSNGAGSPETTGQA